MTNPERIDSILPRVMAEILARQKRPPRSVPPPPEHVPPDPDPQTTLNLEAR